MKNNYHTHTTRCLHAVDCDEDYVLSAIRGGITELGFSDHSPWKYNSNYVARMRMPLSQFDDYYNSISFLKEKYKNKISIKIGLECEYFPKYMDWLTTFIKEKKLDYVILGMHFDGSDEDGVYYGYACDYNKNLDSYIENCKEGIKTGIFSYLCHPDLFMRGRIQFDSYAEKKTRELCLFCKEHDMPLEYNLEGALVSERYGTKGYPHPKFWEIASEIGNEVIIGFDAHEAKSLERLDLYNQAITYLNSLGMKVIYKIPYRF